MDCVLGDLPEPRGRWRCTLFERRQQMLVLSRKAGEEIAMSNGDIRISVLGITGNRVRWASRRPRESPYIG